MQTDANMVNIQLQLACVFLSNVKAVLKAKNISSTKRNAFLTLCSSPPAFLTIRSGDYWWVSTKVGEEVGCFLRAKVEEANQLVPPVNGWQFYKYDGSIWSSDPTLECSRDCRTVAAEVDYAAKAGDIAGIKQLQQRDTSGKLSCHQRYIIISIIKFHQQLQSLHHELSNIIILIINL